MMAGNLFDADLDELRRPRSAETATDTRSAWLGFLGGAVVLVLAILIAVGTWRFVGTRTPQLTIAELTEAERLLDQLGFPPGPADGVIDEESSNAVRDFQVTVGLAVDGELDWALLDELRAAKAELKRN